MTHDPNAVAHAASDVAEPVPPTPIRAHPLDPVARVRIARGLRLLYAEVLTQPVPDALRALADDLAARLDAPPPARPDTRRGAGRDADPAAPR